MIHHQVWFWLEEVNDAIVPGPGQLVGFGKKDVFGPVDLIPVLGPVRKLHKVTKVWKHRRKVKHYAVWGLSLAADLFAVKEVYEWYDQRYRDIVTLIDEEESPSPSQSGNADDKISGGGGIKKKQNASPNRYLLGSKRLWKKGHNPCDKGYIPRKIKGKWYCVRK